VDDRRYRDFQRIRLGSTRSKPVSSKAAILLVVLAVGGLSFWFVQVVVHGSDPGPSGPNPLVGQFEQTDTKIQNLLDEIRTDRDVAALQTAGRELQQQVTDDRLWLQVHSLALVAPAGNLARCDDDKVAAYERWLGKVSVVASEAQKVSDIADQALLTDYESDEMSARIDPAGFCS